MSFTERAQSSATFTPRSLPSGTIVAAGDMTEEDWIALLGAAPTFETLVSQVVGGGKAFGDITFEDQIDLRGLNFTARAQAAAVTFTPRSAS